MLFFPILSRDYLKKEKTFTNIILNVRPDTLNEITQCRAALNHSNKIRQIIESYFSYPNLVAYMQPFSMYPRVRGVN